MFWVIFLSDIDAELTQNSTNGGVKLSYVLFSVAQLPSRVHLLVFQLSNDGLSTGTLTGEHAVALLVFGTAVYE